jgi:hypothetical protein
LLMATAAATAVRLRGHLIQCGRRSAANLQGIRLAG